MRIFSPAKYATFALTTLWVGTALAQTPSLSTPGGNAPGGNIPGATRNTPMPGVSNNTGVTPDTGVVDRNRGTAAAAGDRNQAVATTTANAPQPAQGKNSFTQNEARRRLESNGFQKVNGLRKDDGGVWRGTAMKNGQSAQVWLDYKGNTGSDLGMPNGGNLPGSAVSRATDRALGTTTTTSGASGNATGTRP